MCFSKCFSKFYGYLENGMDVSGSLSLLYFSGTGLCGTVRNKYDKITSLTIDFDQKRGIISDKNVFQG